MNYLVDTCVISELVRPSPSKSVVEWISQQHETKLFVSVLTLAELHRGIFKLGMTKKRKQLERWLEIDLRQRFEGRIIPVDEDISRTWGQIQARAEKAGRTMSVFDGLIAATGIAKILTVVSRNTKEMAPSKVPTLNPWN